MPSQRVFLEGLGGGTRGRAPEPEMTHKKTSLNKPVHTALRGRKFWVRSEVGSVKRAAAAPVASATVNYSVNTGIPVLAH